MKKLNVLLVACLLSTLSLTAQEPAAPAADPAGPIVAAQVENGACGMENQDGASLALFAPDPVHKACGIIYAPCGSPAGAGPCKWSCPCPTWDECQLLDSNGCRICASP
jgi:hypothetical protein